MAKHQKRRDRAEKLCVTCGRPFAWRRKWAAVWNEVKYCSERCRRNKPGEKKNR
ncbi:MAG: DUF2256 domain-containing protein [Pseudomonadota bacterium]